jgi:hypothetical protein
VDTTPCPARVEEAPVRAPAKAKLPLVGFSQSPPPPAFPPERILALAHPTPGARDPKRSASPAGHSSGHNILLLFVFSSGKVNFLCHFEKFKWLKIRALRDILIGNVCHLGVFTHMVTC